MPRVVEGDGQDRPRLGVQHRGMQSRGHTGLGLTRGVKEVSLRESFRSGKTIYGATAVNVYGTGAVKREGVIHTRVYRW